MSDSTLWIFFIVFAVAGAGIFLYAFRALGPSRDAERQVMELQNLTEDE